jgi:hypothetical protein
VKPVLFALPPPPNERSSQERAALKRQGSFGVGDGDGDASPDDASPASEGAGEDIVGKSFGERTGDAAAGGEAAHLRPLAAPLHSPLVLKSVLHACFGQLLKLSCAFFHGLSFSLLFSISRAVPRSGLLERRHEGLVFGAWLPVLAVLTADKALHLFNLPKVKKLIGQDFVASSFGEARAPFFLCV